MHQPSPNAFNRLHISSPILRWARAILTLLPQRQIEENTRSCHNAEQTTLFIVRLENDFTMPRIEGDDGFMEYFLANGSCTAWIVRDDSIVHLERFDGKFAFVGLDSSLMNSRIE